MLSGLSNHYIIATTTDFTPKGDVYAYHVSRIDIMPIFLAFVVVLFSLIMWDITRRILIIIRKKQL
jgi:hypothetical protein